jgi:hypothetical protein
MRTPTLLSMMSALSLCVAGLLYNPHVGPPLFGPGFSCGIRAGLIWHFAEIRNRRQFTRWQAVTWWLWSVAVLGLLTYLLILVFEMAQPGPR